jgi:hypothetical protein
MSFPISFTGIARMGPLARHGSWLGKCFHGVMRPLRRDVPGGTTHSQALPCISKIPHGLGLSFPTEWGRMWPCRWTTAAPSKAGAEISEPGAGAQLSLVVAKAVTGLRICPCGIFPLGLSRKPILLASPAPQPRCIRLRLMPANANHWMRSRSVETWMHLGRTSTIACVSRDRPLGL